MGQSQGSLLGTIGGWSGASRPQDGDVNEEEVSDRSDHRKNIEQSGEIIEQRVSSNDSARRGADGKLDRQDEEELTTSMSGLSLVGALRKVKGMVEPSPSTCFRDPRSPGLAEMRTPITRENTKTPTTEHLNRFSLIEARVSKVEETPVPTPGGDRATENYVCCDQENERHRLTPVYMEANRGKISNIKKKGDISDEEKKEEHQVQPKAKRKALFEVAENVVT